MEDGRFGGILVVALVDPVNFVAIAEVSWGTWFSMEVCSPALPALE